MLVFEVYMVFCPQSFVVSFLFLFFDTPFLRPTRMGLAHSQHQAPVLDRARPDRRPFHGRHSCHARRRRTCSELDDGGSSEHGDGGGGQSQAPCDGNGGDGGRRGA